MSHMYKSIIHGNAIIWAEKGRRQPWPVSNLTFKNQRQKLCSGLILFLKIFAMDAILLTSDCYKKLLFLSHLKGILVRFWTKLNGFTATSHRCPTCCSYNCTTLLEIETEHAQAKHRQNLLNKCPRSMIEEHLSSLGPFFFLFPLPLFYMHSAAYLFANQVRGSHFVQSTVSTTMTY